MANNIILSAKRDPDLFRKIKAVARHEYLSVNTLAKQILHKGLEQLIGDLGITIPNDKSEAQSVCAD